MALAYALGLTYAISAGVIAILSISDTRQRHHQAGLPALYVNLAGPCYRVSPFLFRVQPLGIGCLLSLSMFLVPFYCWQIGITPSTVLVTHLLIEQSTSWGLLLNELCSLFNWNQLCPAGQSLYAFESGDDHYHDVVEDQLKRSLVVCGISW